MEDFTLLHDELLSVINTTFYFSSYYQVVWVYFQTKTKVSFQQGEDGGH